MARENGGKVLELQNGKSEQKKSAPIFRFIRNGYSTVTDFARFLGLSTSQPRASAM